VPEVSLLDGLFIRAVDDLRGKKCREEIEMARLGLVKSGQQTVDRSKSVLGGDA